MVTQPPRGQEPRRNPFFYIIGILVIVTVASLAKTRKDPSARAHAGSLRASRKEPREE